MRRLQPGWYDHRALEASVLRKWREERIYQQVKHANERGEVYYFLDGPPFTTGGIHLGTAYNKVLKDVHLRHLRMQGYNVWDRAGFDVHGLPVEVAVERLLNLSGAEQIEAYGVDKFVQSCRTNVKDSINKMIREFAELGVWLDFENPYIPATREYVQSAWWTVKRAIDSGSLTRQRRILTWCPRCETAVGGAEVQRRMSTLSSAYVKIPLRDKKNEFIVVWTNQLWTLPMAVAVAVNPDAKYVKAVVKTPDGVEKLIMLESTIARMLFKAGFTKYEREATLTGRELVGEHIVHPLLAEVPQQRGLEGEWVHRIIASDYVKEIRTGAIYIAPGVCAPDWDIAIEFKLPILSPIDREGRFLADFSPKYGGFRTSEASPMVVRDVQSAGLMLFEAQEKHPVKACWRCDAPLIHRFDEEWFLNISAVKPHMLAEIKAINWMPEHLGSTQIREWIEKATEWCVSRRRFWGTPIPYWRCIAEGCGGHLVLDRVDDLRRAKGYRDGVDVHLPDIDRLTFPCPKCGADMYRT
ncbi:MAG TPA: class I tRNA ligase family protein, partial [Thermoplasmata archaeon]|nr:class I tRNA ligase family protein [Thermoplasmata archaeon]